MRPRLAASVLVVVTLAGCSVLPVGNKSQRAERIYLLETVADISPVRVRSSCTVVVNVPNPAPGFDGAAMHYIRSPMQIERFAFSSWAASPVSMIEPLLQRALRESGAFSAVLPAPAAIVTDLRVESDQLRLVQVFSGDSSELQLSMSAQVYAPAERGLLASREFRYALPTSAAGPEAGVKAANQAVAMLMADFTSFVVDATQQLETACSR